jgi:hypothetical protein
MKTSPRLFALAASRRLDLGFRLGTRLARDARFAALFDGPPYIADVNAQRRRDG